MEDHYIEEAWDFIKEAEAEFKKGEKERNLIIMRDACEKAWGAVIQATNALFIKRGVSPLPKSHRERRIKLRELESADSQLRQKNFFDRFMARDHILHQRAFYDGDVVPDEVEVEFRKVEELIKDVAGFS